VSSARRGWLIVLAVAIVCGVAVGVIALRRHRTLSPASWLNRLPRQDTLVAYIDFDALRRAGILQLLDGSKVGEDPEYRGFVKKTQFNYLQDLDAAMVAFAPNGKFMLLKGRFDWPSLHSYVEGAQGKCYNSLCRMVGSAPERRISFFPVLPNLMAMAVSPDESAALRMTTPADLPYAAPPNAPVWLSIPPSSLKTGGNLPTGTSMFARGLEQAEAVTLTLAPEGSQLAARLDVRCRAVQDAADIAAHLTKATALLREMIEREHQKPNPADFSGVLASGKFNAEGARVKGYWPIERAFVENALAQ
jgi:hypothetical protein